MTEYSAIVEVSIGRSPGGGKRLEGRWAAASRSQFPLTLQKDDVLRLSLSVDPLLSAPQITGIDPPLSGELQVSPPGPVVTLTATQGTGVQQSFSFSVKGRAVLKREREWSTDPELILRTGMNGGM